MRRTHMTSKHPRLERCGLVQEATTMHSMHILVKHTLITLSALALSLAATGRQAAAQNYTITDLGTLGGINSQPARINAAGTVAGQAYMASGAIQAFHWNPNGANGTTGAIHNISKSGDRYSYAWGVNDADKVVGEVQTALGVRGFLSSGSDRTLIGTFGGTQSSATGINNANQIVGSATTTGDLGPYAFLYKNGTMRNLGTLGGVGGSRAFGINDLGQVVGQSSSKTGPNGVGGLHPFLWTPTQPNGNSGAMVDLGILSGASDGVATDINKYGQVVGTCSLVLSWGSAYSAFLWMPTAPNGTVGRMIPLGINGFANGINSFGQIVGSFYATDRGVHPYLWTPDKPNGTTGDRVDLHSLLPANSGWLGLSSALSINDFGQITGVGTLNNGQSHAFLLTPTAAWLGWLTIQPDDVTGGSVTKGKVTLMFKAPANGAVVSLTSSNPAVARVPATMSVGAGKNIGTFDITTSAVSATTTVAITATLGSVSKTAVLTIQPVAPTYQVTALTVGSEYVYVYGLNASGQVAGSFFGPSTNWNGHALLWSPTTPNATTGAMQDLGLLPNSSYTGAYGINDLGHVVGTGDTANTPESRGFLYRDGVMTPLNLPGTGTAVWALDNTDRVIGYYHPDPYNGARAFWWQDGFVHDLGVLPGAYDSAANGINASGQIVGTSGNFAFLYRNGMMQNLGTLGGNSSYGRGINDEGQVVGYSLLAGNINTHAFRYREDVLQDLGTLPGGPTSYAYGINRWGHTVGSSDTTVNSLTERHAILYSGNVMYDLNQRIPANSGWKLNEALAINDVGQIIGQGTLNGQFAAFLLTPIR